MSDYTELDDPVSGQIRKACTTKMAPPEIVLKGCVLPRNFLNYYKRIESMEVRENDIWVISFPKCGTTWTQEMVWILANNMDFENAGKIELYKRFPFLDFSGLWPEGSDVGDSVATVIEMKSRRFIKTHLPPSLLPTQLFSVNPKIIYVARDPRDAAISYYHHFRLWNDYEGTLEDFLEAFVQDKMVFSPFWEHVRSFWDKREQENILILTYEDMKTDLKKEVIKTAKFLEVEYDETETRLIEHLSFSSMSQNKMVNFENDIAEMKMTENHAFIRKGEKGGYKTAMPPEYKTKFNEWTKNKLEGVSPDFPYKPESDEISE